MLADLLFDVVLCRSLKIIASAWRGSGKVPRRLAAPQMSGESRGERNTEP